MEGGDDFYTGGPAEGDSGPTDLPTADGAPESGYGGGDFSSGGFDQPAGGFEQQPYASLDEPQDEGIPEVEEEPEPTALDEFTRQWETSLREKAALQEQVKADALATAEGELQHFAEERAAMKEAKMSSNRTAEQVFLEQLEGDLESDNPWERVVSLVDMQAEQTDDFQDTGRMRSIFIQLKNDPVETSPPA